MLTKGERDFASKIAFRFHFRASILKKFSLGEHFSDLPNLACCVCLAHVVEYHMI